MVHFKNERGKTAWFESFLDKINVPVEIFMVTENLDSNSGKEFAACFTCSVSGNKNGKMLDSVENSNPSHVIIVSPLPERWLVFFAGFSWGFNLPFLIYGSDAMERIPEEFISNFTLFEAKEPLQEYLQNEYEISKKDEEILEVQKARNSLLQMGIPVNEESFVHCVGHGRIDEFPHFLASGFSPDTRDKTGVPLLNIAARKGQREIIRLLIEAGAQLNLRAGDRNTSALMDGVLEKHKELVKDLIEAGADPNIQSKDGQTALIVAVGIGNDELVEVLLKARADPDISDSLGMSARKYASMFHKKTITELFDTYAPIKSEQ